MNKTGESIIVSNKLVLEHKGRPVNFTNRLIVQIAQGSSGHVLPREDNRSAYDLNLSINTKGGKE